MLTALLCMFRFFNSFIFPKNKNKDYTSNAWPIPKNIDTFFWNEFPWTCSCKENKLCKTNKLK
jgi:hypothetical protein